MKRQRIPVYVTLLSLLFFTSLLMGGLAAVAAPSLQDSIYLPVVHKSPPVEFRGLWITRFEWAIGKDPTPAAIDRIVDKAASAGFNALLFQVRGTADAYYDSQVEPWAAALGGALGVDPGWDPLARMIAAAHARGLQVHAYVNVYPVWTNTGPPPRTAPLHLYHKLQAEYGTVDGKNAGLQWNRNYEIPGEYYLRATPASFLVDEQMVAVVADLVTRYDLDGVHLDHIRYGGPANSCDPVTEARIGGPCFTTVPSGHNSFEDWQRAQVNGTVHTLYRTLFERDQSGNTLAPRTLRLSAAVWPFYNSGYHNYYQDPKAWLAGGYIDAIMPMLYGSIDDPDVTPDPLGRWRELAAGFQADNYGRHVILGMHGDFDSFADIANRIGVARSLGAAGHAIFAYSYLDAHDYWDDLAAGPYREEAIVPGIGWRAKQEMGE